MEFDRVTELFDKGGFIMIVIMALSIYVGAVILFKFYQLWKLSITKTGFIDQIYANLANRDIKSSLAIANLNKHPVARVIESALIQISRPDTQEDKIKEEVERVGSAELRYLESHMRGLEMASNVAPLLGLLGTVIGMVAAFSTLEQAGSRVNPSLLAGGIWTALLTTVAGLTVAIPALAAHYFFDGQVEKVRAMMGDASTRILALRNKLRPAQAPKPAAQHGRPESQSISSNPPPHQTPPPQKAAPSVSSSNNMGQATLVQ